MMSKAIMDKHDTMKRGDARDTSIPTPMVENFDMPQVKYNIPQEFLSEQPSAPQQFAAPRENTKPVGVPTVDAIKNSKLPDEIKRLMIEHPIAQAQQPQVTISDDLIEKASRLMKKSSDNNYMPESAQKPTTKVRTETGIDYGRIQDMIKEAVNEALKENGLISESSEKTNEIFSFKVGKHIFEGKVTKIKKLG